MQVHIHMYIYIYMYVHMYMYMYMYISIYIYICMYICMTSYDEGPLSVGSWGHTEAWTPPGAQGPHGGRVHRVARRPAPNPADLP